MASGFELSSISSLLRPKDDHAKRCSILLSGLSDFIDEFSLIEPSDLIAFVHNGHLPNIADLVSSSAEMSFKPGRLSFGWRADVEVSWCSPPLFLMDLKFCHKGVTALFRLRLGDVAPAIELRLLEFEYGGQDTPQDGPQDALQDTPLNAHRLNTRRLAIAMRDARLD